MLRSGMVKVSPNPGVQGWACECVGYPLPDGLSERTPLTVTRRDGFDVRAKDADGREWALFLTTIDTGYFWMLGDRQIHESSPVAAEFLRHQLAEIARDLETDADSFSGREDGLLAFQASTRWMLERNGHDPDESPKGEKPRLTGLPPGESSAMIRGGRPTTGGAYRGRVRS